MMPIFLFSALICDTLASSSLKEVQEHLLKDEEFMNKMTDEFKNQWEQRERKEHVNKCISNFLIYMFWAGRLTTGFKKYNCFCNNSKAI